MFAVHGACLCSHTHQVTMRNTSLVVGNMVQPKDYVVLPASRGFLGPKRRWPDEETAERASLGNHRFYSPKTYQGANKLIIHLAPCGFLAFTRKIVLFQGTSTYQKPHPVGWRRAPMLTLHRGCTFSLLEANKQLTSGCEDFLGYLVS